MHFKRDLATSTIHDTRMSLLESLRVNTGDGLYENSVAKPSISIRNFLQKYKDIPDGSRLKQESPIRICGRILAIRHSSKKLSFYQIASNISDSTIQILAESQHYSGNSKGLLSPENQFIHIHQTLRRGDIIAVDGFPGKSKKGELSLIPQRIALLAPCLKDIPGGRGDGKYSLKDKAFRYNNRHVDLLANRDDSFNAFKIRTEAINFMRRFLIENEFLEVETPILQRFAGGASAKPFYTRLEKGNQELSLRIAPELLLKTLVVGGIERVFEIGKVFRNEGLSPFHNPEFTTCEFYKAYSDYNDLMAFTERLLPELVYNTVGSHEISYQGQLISFKPPFKRISIVQALEIKLGIPQGSFPDLALAGTGSLRQKLVPLVLEKLPKANQEDLEKIPSDAKFLEFMLGQFLEPDCIQPTFICDHPVVLSPLAKKHGHNPNLCERFELFVAGKEVANAYSELNDPEEQLIRFKEQSALFDAGDNEAMPLDMEFVEALKYGLPPTAGWGLGIDRLVMLLTDSASIRDVIYFPFR